MSKLSVEQALAKAKLHIKKGESAEAQALYATILKAFPNSIKAQQGLAASGKTRQPNATQYPPETAINQLANLFNKGHLALVAQQAEALTKDYPNNFVIWSFMGGANLGIGQAAKAAKAFSRVTQLNPNYPEGHNNLGSALQKLRRYEESLKCFKNALSFNPDYSDAYYNIGISYRELSKLDLAIEAYERSLALNSTNWEAYGNMGLAFKDKDEWAKAISAYEKALEINPNDPGLISNMGNVFKDQGKLEEAIEAYTKALAIKPDYADAYNNMGITLQDQGKLEEAIEAYNKALAIKPDYAEVHYNIGVTLQDQGKLEEAIEAYNKALAIKPDYAEVHYNIGVTLQDQGKLEEAIEAYNKALAIKPDYAEARAVKLHQQAHICDWDSITKDIELIPKLGTTEKHVSTFALLSMEDAPERHRLRSEIFAKARYPQKPLPRQVKPSQKPKRLKIGYFSADFHNHATMYLMAQIFAAHNKVDFEIFAYSYGPDRHDEMRKKLVCAVDQFYDVREMNDMQIANLARTHNIDIAIDLKGYTTSTRLAPFAYGLAPLQISYLGYPGTLGADFIDYIVADPILIPEDKRQHYSEQIVYLPHTYQPTDNRRVISGKAMTREDMGLPDSGFVFCCFNNNYKISPAEFDIWMRLLNSVEGSVLWLLKSNKLSEQNLKRQAEVRGISSERVVFAEKAPQAEHLARQRLADLFLDTFNYNAHTTTSDALWAGLPVVTKIGQGFAARVAGSLLNAVGLPELITETEQDYEALNLELATNPTKLAKVKEKLAANRLTQPLFDTELYTKHLENGYQQAYQNYFDGKPPQTIIVQK